MEESRRFLAPQGSSLSLDAGRGGADALSATSGEEQCAPLSYNQAAGIRQKSGRGSKGR